ncbi:leucine-rich repeat-containing protein 71 [Triplophysa rosa]|uniref:Leucine-rich repeat-containing protein 71 n=1 Tax=Triplophysa rosa TaxID=992332 RepID=A0A9W7TKT1_TRIRA|nr:leucine-rich repeat-containing protein 71 [Triplophysa rosa]KAI7799040.1 leucine-rich repeat-containing protein 71 [Triplophysa rosa]
MKKRGDNSAKEKVDKVDSGIEEDPPKTADDYQCSGNLEMDLQELCKLMGMREIPAVKTKQTEKEPPPDREVMEESQTQTISESQKSMWSPKPCLQVELEDEDHHSTKEVKISGWMVDEQMLQVLNKTLPSLNSLQCLHMWRTGLTGYTFTLLSNTISLCSNLRKVILEGNSLPEQSYHLMIGDGSMLTHLSLRNNCIGEEGARLIGSALSTVHSANKNLLSLNLAFNSIGDSGAVYIAQGLRFNRSLRCLSLSYNHIGDKGAAHLAEVLGLFALTHEEIVERRKLLMKGEQSTLIQPSQVSLTDSTSEPPPSVHSSSSLDRTINNKSVKKKDNVKKEEKPTPGQAAKKEEPKLAKKDSKVARGQTGKLSSKDKNLIVSESEMFVQETVEVTEVVVPLLDSEIQHTGGKVVYPGNSCLVSLNLSGNKLTVQSLKLFLSSLTSQGDGGLQRLSLNRNRFSPECDTFLKIQELLSPKDSFNKNSSGQVEDEEQVEAQTTGAA